MSLGGGRRRNKRPTNQHLEKTQSNAKRAGRAVAEFLRTETVGGLILLAAATAGLIIANTPLQGTYRDVRDAVVGPAALHLNLSIGTWTADGLLAVFFFIAGLELKREFVVGELRDRRRAMLPVLSALGGMIIPAALCALISFGAPGGGDAWPVPVATDIAFALAVLAIAAPGLPSSLRVFLLSLAVIDDLGVIALIAVVFTESLQWIALIVAITLLAGYALLQRLRVRSPLIYVPLAAAVWVTVHYSGIHATVAGIALALLTRVETDPDEEQSPAQRLEHRLQPWSAGLCVPLFGFFAAGLAINAATLTGFAADRVVWAVMAGLVLGKLLGVFGGARAAVALGLAKLPKDVNWWDLTALASVAGCGFTVSLLIAELAFGATSQGEYVKLAVLVASTVAGFISATLLRLRLHARR